MYRLLLGGTHSRRFCCAYVGTLIKFDLGGTIRRRGNVFARARKLERQSTLRPRRRQAQLSRDRLGEG